ncbi:hypothetical protein DACRYDRAFT_98642 [Dacryopinax primogenitus]|uniref:Senescence domain-containing protein n=1 Tax=Dacryopinax primogenitus (strain DJM 731) TaxID=1858805 RepID=M5G9F5_DACPD|nr:uncharacterized protein DACRYDRAFT_98642 [Dacryopinax primogenitus]EJU04870.1 hypothetical protein DACRYDRAFT_98642 [Dacryopinax primogenitus]
MNIQPTSFLLLSLPHACVIFSPSTPDPPPRSLDLICVTYPAPSSVTPPPEEDAQPQMETLLLLRLGSLDAEEAQDIPLLPSTRFLHPNPTTFLFPHTSPPISLNFPSPSQQEQTDIDTFNLLLQDYASLPQQIDDALSPLSPLSPSPLSPSAWDTPAYADNARGHLLLVDHTSGAILGQVPNLHLTEHPDLKPHDPVIITLPSSPISTSTPVIPPGSTQVRPAETEEEFALILQGATLLSHAIQSATSVLAGGITYAAQLYVSHVPPSPSGPTHLSKEAKETVARVHAFSGQAVRVAEQTTGAVHRLIDRAIDRAGTAAGSLIPSDTSNPNSNADAAGEHGTPPPKSTWREATRLGGKLFSRVLISADLLLTSLSTSATQLVDTSSESLSLSLEHRYGPEVGNASRELTRAVRDVGVVYVDARGVGHRALLRQAGARVVRVGIAQGSGERGVLGEEEGEGSKEKEEKQGEKEKEKGEGEGKVEKGDVKLGGVDEGEGSERKEKEQEKGKGNGEETVKDQGKEEGEGHPEEVKPGEVDLLQLGISPALVPAPASASAPELAESALPGVGVQGVQGDGVPEGQLVDLRPAEEAGKVSLPVPVSGATGVRVLPLDVRVQVGSGTEGLGMMQQGLGEMMGLGVEELQGLDLGPADLAVAEELGTAGKGQVGKGVLVDLDA